MHKIDSSRLDLARQFRDQPFGPHSTELQKVLKILRWDPIDDRLIAVQPQRGGRWQLARSTGRKGSPIEIFEGTGFAYAGRGAMGDLPSPLAAPHRSAAAARRRRAAADQGAASPPTSAGARSWASADLFSVEAGGRIAFKVSAEASYRVGDRAPALR